MNKRNGQKIFSNSAKRKQFILKSLNNYLLQLSFHYELSNSEIIDVLQIVQKQYKKTISSKKWWKIFG